MSALLRPNQVPPACSIEAAIFRRKWQAGIAPGKTLPAYEDIVLGSLGRLADRLLVVEGHSPDSFKVLRCGRGVHAWLGSDTDHKRVCQLPKEFAGPLASTLERALKSGQPECEHARRVRGGMVETFELLVLPLWCRWGATLLAVHISEVGIPFNLVDTIFRSTQEGILALAAVRDTEGVPYDFQVVAFNSGALRLLGGGPADDLQWSYLSELKHELITPAMLGKLFAVLATTQNQQFELPVTIDGNEIHLSVSVAAAGDLISTTLTDVTEIKRREESFRLLFDDNPVPMWLYDPETLRFAAVNAAAVGHYGYSRQRFAAMTLRDLCPEDERELHCSIAQTIGNSYYSDRTWRHIKADNQEIEVITYARRLAFAGRQAVMVAIVDVTERKQAEARIAYMAQHDALTGLPNRVLFRERLDAALAQLGRRGGLLAVHCLDLDHFNSVNDTLGHPIGDDLLRVVAERLKHNLRDCDLVARLGGDEFAVIQMNIERPSEASDLAAKLIAALSANYDIQCHEVVIGASIGIALAPGDGDAADILLRNADMALYRAKTERGSAHFFEPEMDRRIQARRVLELDLRKVFANGEFDLHYQPLINLDGDRISGFEALLRWHHPERGMVLPGEFIAVAEEIGLIAPLGEWVLRQACTEAARWPGDLKIAVNLSPAQFRTRSVVQAVLSALAYSGLAPHRLELEITESVLLGETEANLATLHQLRAFGARISMDDFGTGYSSLSYLRSFPFDKIKIDRSFVRDLAERPDCMAIIRAVAGLGASLGISTTAEGVETREQLERLRAEGCTEAQGFLFSPPRPAAELAALLALTCDWAKVA